MLDESGFSDQVMEDVSFTQENINEAYIKQASLFAFYAEQSRMASKKMDNYKLRIGVIEAELDKELRDDAAKSGTKITENAIEQAISRDEKYTKAVMAYNDAKATAQMLRDVLDALKQKKDCLIQVGLTMRDEFKAQMRLTDDVETTSKKDSLKDRRDNFAKQRELMNV